jgi:glycine/betaine/sarcosine/D-proline reductase family selenoprotein B
MTKELERAGIAVAMISALPSVPLSIGAHRVIKGVRVEHLCGDPSLSKERDRELMLSIAKSALRAIQTEVTRPTLFDPANVGNGGPA